MALPHYRNSKASMRNYEPIYNAHFEIILTPPSGISEWDLVMENVKKVEGIDVNKQPEKVTQTFKSAVRTFAGGVVSDTSITFTIEFEVNLNESNSAYVYKQLRKWTDLIYDPLTGRMGLKKDYVGGPMIINYHNKAGDIFRQVKCPVVFPVKALPPIGSDYSDNGIYTISMEFVADYWEEIIL